MYTPFGRVFVFAVFAIFVTLGSPSLQAQSGSNSGTILGTVTDPTGAVVIRATVTILNPVSGYNRSTVSDGAGHYEFHNIPFDPYHLTVAASGFNAYATDVDVRSTVPVSTTNSLTVGGDSTVISVDAGDLIETTPPAHRDRPRAFDKIPLESQSSSLSSLVTLASPGVAADSNGLFHGLGDHASNSFSIDGQPITDQQSKVFSNQLPSNSVQSLEVISGAPPAEYGGKTSAGHRGHHPLRPRRHHAHRQRHHLLRHLRLRDRLRRPQLRRQELGQLHRGRRPQHRPLPRSAGVRRLPRQGQRAERLRPRRPSAHRRTTRSTST